MKVEYTGSSSATKYLAFWSRHISQWRSSGLNQSKYCLREGIAVSSFSSWKKRIERSQKVQNPATQGQTGHFIELETKPADESHSIPIRIGRLEITFKHDTDINLLKKLINEIEVVS